MLRPLGRLIYPGARPVPLPSCLLSKGLFIPPGPGPVPLPSCLLSKGLIKHPVAEEEETKCFITFKYF